MTFDENTIRRMQQEIDAVRATADAAAAKLLAIKTACAAFAPTNKTIDRGWDCDTALVAELCDVVATLADDIEAAAT